MPTRTASSYIGVFARNLRKRIRDLGMSDAQAARLCGLNERRFAYYVTGEREPSLSILVSIAERLSTTPDKLLLAASDSVDALSSNRGISSRIEIALTALSDEDCELVAGQIESLVRFRRLKTSYRTARR